MPRATWKGFVSFGLVSIPVLLYSGEKRTDVQFDLLDVRDQGKIRYRRVNEETGEEVPWDQIVRAYEYENGNYVMMQEEDFTRVSVEATKSINVDAFVEKSAVEPYFYEKPYIIVPQKGGEKVYALLREVLRSSDRVGIAKVIIRGREYLVGLISEGNAIIANRMRFAQELVNPDDFELPGGTLRDYGITAQDLDMAEKLVDAMSQAWQPGKYHDDYREALLDWIDKKVRTGEGAPQEEEAGPVEQSRVIDITDLLRRSLEQVKH